MLLLLAPAALVLVLFQVFPIIIGADASFREWALYDPSKEWVGLKNYKGVLSDPVFWKLVLPNTFGLMLVSVLSSTVLGIVIALSLRKTSFVSSFVQSLVMFPLLIAPVVIATMMRWIFNDQFGLVTIVMEGLGFDSVSWFSNRWTAFSVIAMTDIWIWTPWFTLLFVAALRSMSREPYEAASIDGASQWRVFRYITLPLLRPVLLVCIVIRFIDAFRTFETVWVLTGGGPARQTEVISVYAYMEAFHSLDFAKGSAAAFIGAIIIVVLGIGLYRILDQILEVSK